RARGTSPAAPSRGEPHDLHLHQELGLQWADQEGGPGAQTERRGLEAPPARGPLRVRSGDRRGASAGPKADAGGLLVVSGRGGVTASPGRRPPRPTALATLALRPRAARSGRLPVPRTGRGPAASVAAPPALRLALRAPPLPAAWLG